MRIKINLKYKTKRMINKLLVSMIVASMVLCETQLGNIPQKAYASEATEEIYEEEESGSENIEIDTSSNQGQDTESETTEEVTPDITTEAEAELDFTAEPDSETTNSTSSASTEEVNAEEETTTEEQVVGFTPSTQLNGNTSADTEAIEETTESQTEDLTVSGSMTLTSDMTVGNLDVSKNTTLKLNGYTLTVEGNSTIKGNIEFGKGELICYNDINISSDACITMDNANDYMIAYGKMTYYGKSKLTAGVIEVKGDFTANNSFVAEGTHKVIFSGDSEQKISVSDEGMFNDVELRNFSSAGVTVICSFNYNSLTDNDCVINYEDLGGERGYTLTEDTEFNGTYYLVSDTLDLNGYTMTINGDLIQAGGTIHVNGGKLIINGSYRVQSRSVKDDTEITYGKSTGALNMTDESDYIYIDGDFISETAIDHTDKLTEGIMEITGDVDVSKKYSLYAFVSNNNHTVILSGDEAQNIKIDIEGLSNYLPYSKIRNLVINNASEDGISFLSKLHVSGSIDTKESKISGCLAISDESSFVDNQYIGDVYIYGEDVLLTDDLSIMGDVTIAGSPKLNYNLTISGNISSSKGTLKVNGKNIIVSGDSTGLIYDMSNSADYVYVGGNLDIPKNDKMNFGTVETAGNLTIGAYSSIGEKHRVILSGDKLQKVDTTSTLGILEIKNYSDEGVYSDLPIPKNVLIRNGCKLTYGSIAGEFGWTLAGDETYEGDLILIDDELNLNGHTLTVNGNLIQLSGTVNTNGGDLIVKGDYRMQGVEGDISEENYTESTGVIDMKSGDKITVEGDVYYYSDNQLNGGTLELKGDFYSGYFDAAEGTKVIFSGDKEQIIGDNSKTFVYLPNLVFDNSSAEGIRIVSDIRVSESIDDNDTIVNGIITADDDNIIFADNVFQGSLRLRLSNYKIGSMHIMGDLYNTNTIYVNDGTNLTVDGDIINTGNLYVYGQINVGGSCDFGIYSGVNILDGQLNITEDLKLSMNSSGFFAMSRDESSVIVGGDFTSATGGKKVSLSKGVLEVKGDIDLNTQLVAQSTHTLLLNGDKLQTVKVTDNTSWGTIELQNYSADGVFAEKVFSKQKLIRNGCRLRYGDCQGEFGWTLTADQIWEGDLIIIDDTLDLNGYTLTVTGSLIQQAGDIKVNGGKLIANGDYRMQTLVTSDDGITAYESGASRLIMDSESDYALVYGDYIVGTKTSQKDMVTNGTLELKGDLYIDNATQSEAFYFDEAATLILSGASKQIISTTSTDTKIHMGSIRLNNTSGKKISTDGKLEIHGKVSTGVNAFDNPVYIVSETTYENNIFNGDIIIDTDTTIDHHDVVVNGNAQVLGNYRDLATLTLNGDMVINGDVVFDYGTLTMTNNDACLEVNGDLNYYSYLYESHIKAGTIKVSGDITSTGKLIADGTNKVILDGELKQTIDILDTDYLNILEIKNTSIEGVYSENYLYLNQLIDTDNKLTIGSINYQNGYTLTQDTTISGDYYLGYGELNLNGFKLTIEGNLIHAGGDIVISEGELNIEGDYIQKAKLMDEGVENWASSTSCIIMNKSNDRINISGDMDLYPKNATAYDQLINGELNVEGNINFNMDGNSNKIYRFGTYENCQVNLVGDNQSITGQGCEFAKLSINTKNTLIIDTDVIVTKALDSECENITGAKDVIIESFSVLEADTFSGNLCIKKADVLKSSKIVDGTLTVLGNLDLNGYEINCNNLKVNSTLEINGGRINCLEDLIVNYNGILVMTDSNDYICVGSDMTFNSNKSHTDKLTAGTMELKGDFTDTYKMFKASGTHKTILGIKYKSSGKEYIQSITFNYADSIFNTLVLKKDVSKYTFSRAVDDMAVEVIYETEDIALPQPVTELKTTATDMTSVTIEYVHEDNAGTIGYEIYRDGERIGSTGILSYKDTGLEPDTTYTYQVYPVNSLYQQSTTAPTLKVKTLADTQAPSVPANLSITGVTGSSIQISWSASTDNRGVMGYEIYRDNLLVDTIAYPDVQCEYKDTQLADKDEHIYKVIAYDAAANKSEESEEVTGKAMMPVIIKACPEDYSNMDNNTQQLSLYYKNMGYSNSYSVEIMYKSKDTDTWTTLDTGELKQRAYNAQTYYVSYDWDTSVLDKLEYDIKYTVKDEDGNEASTVVTYYVDNVPPSVPGDLKITSKSGVISLDWDVSVAYDCDGYRIYRRIYNSGDDYKLIHAEKNPLAQSYKDKDIAEGEFYEYVITAIDTSGNESDKSKSVIAKNMADDEAPVISSVTPEAGKIGGITRLDISASDNRELSSVSIFYRAENNDSFSKLDDISYSGDKVSYSLDTASLDDGVYYFNFVATDVAGNASIEEYTRRYEVDNTGISKINIEEVIESSTFVQLKWEDVSEEDFAYFSVEQYHNGSYFTVGKVTDVLGYTIEDLKPNTSYRFRVVGYDTLGNKGEYSDVVMAKTGSDTTKPVINIVYPSEVRHRKDIPLAVKASDNHRIKYASFYYSYDGESFTKLSDVTNYYNDKSTTLECTLDISDISEGKVYVKYEVYDATGNKNALTEDGKDIIAEYIIDRTAPGKPENMMAVSQEGYIALSWDKATDEDVKYYRIYRATAEDGVFVMLRDNLQNATYNDSTVEAGKAYIYRMVAVDKAGNVSEYSNQCTASARQDKTAPYIAGMSKVSGTVVSDDASLEIIAQDNSNLKAIEVDIKDKDLGIWVNLARKDASGSIYRAEVDLGLDYMAEGEYEYRIRAIDEAGNESDYSNMTFTLDTTPAKAGIEASAGDLCINLNIELPSDEDFSYVNIYRRQVSLEGEAEGEFTRIYTGSEESYRDKDIIPWQNYEYKLHSYDQVGNCYVSDTVISYGTDNDTENPVAVVPDSIRVLEGMEIYIDGGESSDNVRIVSYSWEISDGTSHTGRQIIHSFDEAGVYDVTLTVTDAAGNTASATTQVQVIEKNGAGSIVITVCDTDGKPVPYAYVYLNDSLNSEKSYKTDSKGQVTISAKRGDYLAAAYKAGYIPKDIEVSVSEFEDFSYTITIPKGDIVVGDFSVHRMSLEEMVEAGVDFSAPENMHRFTFEVELEFAEYPIPVEIVYIVDALGGGTFEGEGGGFGVHDSPVGGNGGNFDKEKPKVKVVEPKNEQGMAVIDQPIIVTVRTVQTVSWLKDMYSVELGVLNTADSKYVIEDSCATINLPSGISLAATHSGQGLTAYMGDIAGQERKSITWIVKGDIPGTYDISADFTGNLIPFNCPVNAHFECSQTIGVSAYAGLKITVMPEKTAYTGESYYIQFSVSNETSRPLYNFTTSFGPYTIPGAVSETYVIQPGSEEKDLYDSYRGHTQTIGEMSVLSQTPVLKGDERLSIATLSPGQTIYGTYSCAFPGTADPTSIYYSLEKSMVTVLEGNELGVDVDVKPIGGHISKKIIKGVVRKSMYGDPVDVSSGAYIDEYEAISLTGRDILSLDLYYNSTDAGVAGELGYGWSHNFESYISEDMGMIHYYTSPSACASFINEDSLDGIKYGTFDGNTLNLSADTGKDTITYRSITTGMDGYVLTKNSDGTFAMTTPAGYIYEYGTDGKLTKMTLEEGRSVSISHALDQIIVTEDATGNRLKLDYLNGRLISVTDNTGRTTSFAYTGDYLTTITNPIGETVSYEYDEAGRLTKGKNTYGEAFVTNSYDDAGRVVKQLDDRGNEIGFTYQATDSGMITECIAADGSITTVESDLCGNITKITSPQGAVTSHEYDRLGNKVKSVDAYGNVYSYSYDDEGNLVLYDSNTSQRVAMLYDDNGNLVSATTADGNTSSFAYDEAGNLINSMSGEAAYSYTYDDMGRVTSQTRVGKGTITYGYEGTESQISSITDENGNTSYVDYDSRGNLVSLKDALGNTTSYEYDLMNRPIKSTYPNGAQVIYTYNQYGKITSVTDALGYVTTYSYDAGGRLTQTTYADGSVENYGYDESGNMTTITTADGRSLTYEYDGLGKVTKIIYPDGTTEECSYDMLGQVTSSTDILGNKTSTTYDSTGQVIGVKLPTGQSITATYGDTEATSKQLIGVSDSLGKDVSYTYDSMGNITSVTDALGNKSTCEYNQWGELLTETDAKGNKTTYTYDSAGQCIAVTNPDGTTTNIVYDPCGRVTEAYMEGSEGERLSVSYTYDSMSNISSYTDEMGNTTNYEYDINGNLIKVIDSEGVITAEYTYDCMGKVLQEKDASGIVVTYSYNKSDLVEKVSLTSATGEEKVYTYTYDDMGRVLSVIDPSGNESSQSYDLSGNITELVYPEGGGISYAYDNYGRVTEEKLSIGTVSSYQYNADSLLSQYTNGRGQETKYIYDVLGRITSISDEIGTVSYTYDANGNVLTVSETDKSGKTQTISRSYDCMDRVTSYTDYKGNTVKYSYDELGNLISLTYPGGEIVRYSYDKVGLLTTVTDEEGFVTSYTYDKVGRLHTTTKPDESVETNTYDNLSRLTERTVAGKDGSLINKYTYTYDSWGNIISMGYESSFEGDASTTTFTSASMTYDSSNRMVTYNGEDILYDDDGNMLYGPLDGEMVTFTYDCRNRLTSAGDTIYEYDAENIRTATETPEYREEYVTDTVGDLSRVLVIIRENKTNDKTDVETYYYGNGLIYEKSNDVGILVYHYNHLGSTTAVTDQAGKLVYSYDYGTYGELTTTTEYSTIAPKVRFLYNGQLGVMTDDNSLYYMRQRYYNPQIKRFINQDILTGSIGNSNSLNRYSYVEGNPVSYSDPFGLSPFSYISQPLHNTLDWFGMIPVIGVGLDLVNAMVYLMEGNPTYALFAAFSSIGIGDGVKFVIKNGKNSVIGLTIMGLFCQTDAGAGLKEDIVNLGQDYIHYQGYDQMSPGELALVLTMETFFGAKSGLDDLDIKKKDIDVDIDDFVPDSSPISRGYYQDSTGRWHRPNGDFASNAEVGISNASTTSGKNRGGRLGNEATRAQNREIADYLESQGYTIIGGGGRKPEEYLPGPDGSNKGSNYVDITAQKGETIIRINTVDVLADGKTPTKREQMAAVSISNKTGEVMILIPKGAGLGNLSNDLNKKRR